MIPAPTIYAYIKAEEINFEADEVQLGDNWFWNMRRHVQLIFHLKNSIFFRGLNNWLRAFKNIMEPILNLAYWTEDIEVKDVVFYIESKQNKVLSFLIKKYHDEVYTREHNIDALLDDITKSDIDYGGVLVQKGVERPEVIQLNSIAFADQTEMDGGPIGQKFYLSPSKLMEMGKFGWGDTANGATMDLKELITLASYQKDAIGTLSDRINQVPGKAIEIYIVRGDMPEHYLEDNDNMEDYVSQVQIVAFYKNNKEVMEGVTLYKKKDKGKLKFFASEEVFGRALGRGTGEALMHPQVWTNFLTIHKMGLLEAASKVILQTDDEAYTNRNQGLKDMENLEVTVTEDGKQITQVPTAAVNNIQLYENDVDKWFEHAQFSGAAFDPILGKEAVSGTTFRGQERTVAQGRGFHDRRRGKRAKFIEEIYRDWIIPDIVREITGGKEFMATLDSDDLIWVADQLVANLVSKEITEKVLNGELPPTQEERVAMKQLLKDDFLKQGSRFSLKILKDEFRGIKVKIGINVANKQKDLAGLSDKVFSIFQFVFQNPQAFAQAMQVPALAKSFENILELSGMSIGDFSTLLKAPEGGLQPPVEATQPAAPSTPSASLIPQQK